MVEDTSGHVPCRVDPTRAAGNEGLDGDTLICWSADLGVGETQHWSQYVCSVITNDEHMLQQHPVLPSFVILTM